MASIRIWKLLYSLSGTTCWHSYPGSIARSNRCCLGPGCRLCPASGYFSRISPGVPSGFRAAKAEMVHADCRLVPILSAAADDRGITALRIRHTDVPVARVHGAGGCPLVPRHMGFGNCPVGADNVVPAAA